MRGRTSKIRGIVCDFAAVTWELILEVRSTWCWIELMYIF